MASDNFGDRLLAAVAERGSAVCLGLDPRPDDLPAAALSGAENDDIGARIEGVVRFCGTVLYAAAEFCAAVKLQSAFFEQLGMAGQAAFFELAVVARDLGLLTIADIKRGDIGSTAGAYARAYLGETSPFDAVTVTPYFGSDSVRPFLDHARTFGRGLFVIVRASNPSAAELQDLPLADGRRVHEAVADLVADWGEGLVGEGGYSAVGAVVGATVGDQLAALRRRLPRQPFLVPGYGAQGAGPHDVVAAFDDQGRGALVNSSRGIMYAYKRAPYADRFSPDDYALAAREAARDTRDAINAALREAGKLA